MPPTSEELIADALASNSITLEQSLLYRALALYNSPDLPQQFRSPIPDMHAAGELMREIDASESQLSAATLAQLAPYRVRPNDPASIFNRSVARTGPPVGRLALVAPALVLAAPVAAAPVWKSKPAAGGNTCFASDWLVDVKGTTISGSCYDFKTDRNYWLFEWSLTRIGSGK
jgi:hypothetical protein